MYCVYWVFGDVFEGLKEQFIPMCVSGQKLKEKQTIPKEMLL